MRKSAAVIFDCDGVMFDSRQANIHFYNHLLARFGCPPLKDKDVGFVHMHTADESVRYIFQGTPHIQAAQEYRMEMDYTPFIHDMVMEEGIEDLLASLMHRYGLAVATNRSNTIGKVLEWSGLERFFDIVVSSLDVKNPKPHPESIVKILAFFGIGPDRAVYIGDSAVDYETAGAAGVHFVAYKNEDLDTPFKVNGMSEIEGLLERIGV
ncbi:MAG: HAD-IA family hydrolase [Deltaproteobacteria bacterium]|nr:HAD-IA family hydrolase [Deltaproteobacteria bacterium]